ncbi:MDR family MFS transporter [Paenibacillus thermoaerophilus]|uniref:MDR family MFS transporter n=1 Tax=Paenibacillus thermoaerophilus TaxID=1215385 RepID=A0ABW2UZ52_9BACL|nr:MDR family MFS transporter [Paenibacillus thermoaerophilus]TMV17478.1 MFS transporter [Paenibacillus thermoaerophilus]
MNAVQKKISTALLIATFLAAIEVTIVSTAMPVIIDDLGGVELISWVFAIYLLTSAVTTPIFGKLSDLFGRKIVYIMGVTLFLAGSVLCGLSQTMGQLIAFRGIQGLGAGAINPVTFTIIADAFNFEQRAKVQGLISSMWGIAGIFGPVVGGFFVDYWSWHWIFFINLPFGIVSMWMIGKYFAETLDKKKRRIDYGGAVTFMLGTGALLYALLTGGNELAWNSAAIFALFGIAAVLLTAFFIIQVRHPEPMIPLSLFKKADVAVSNAGGFLTSAILIGLTVYLPLWIQDVLKLGATSSGLTLIPISLGWPIGAMLSGRMMLRYGTRAAAVLGGLWIALGAISLAWIDPSTPTWVLVLIMFLTGLGFGLTTTTFTVVIQSSVEIHMRGAAGSANTFLRALGQTLGVAVLGTVLNQYVAGGAESAERLADGLHAVFVISAVIAVASWIVTLRIPQRDYRQAESRTAPDSK